jgi:hypothetical protein
MIGTWTSKKTKRILKIAVSPLERPASDILLALKRPAEELASFIGVKEAQIVTNP